MPSLTVENYVKAIFQICHAQDGEPAATGQIAGTLGVSPGTVTSMLKTLSEAKLASYTPYEGAQLTEAGRKLALRVLRRHRLIELFLAQTLHLTWDEVHEEAEHMEHAVSELLIDRIDAYLGYPTVDPHGDPIPRADGYLANIDCHALAACRPGERFALVRVVDQSPEFLRYLTECELALGARGVVLSNSVEAGTVTVRVGQRHTTLSRAKAEKLLVQSAADNRANCHE